MTQYSILKLCTIRNLRMQEGKWLIDVIDYSNNKTKTKTLIIGKQLDWRKISGEIPRAVFNKKIKDYLVKESRGITFARLKIEVIDNKGYVIPFNDENGNALVNADTGNKIADDFTESIRKHERSIDQSHDK